MFIVYVAILQYRISVFVLIMFIVRGYFTVPNFRLCFNNVYCMIKSFISFWNGLNGELRYTIEKGLDHSFIPDIYIAPLQETYSEALSIQLRSKRNVLRNLHKEGMLF